MGEAKRRNMIDPNWGQEKEVFPNKNYPCVVIMSYLYNESNAVIALDTYIHDNDNTDEAWSVLKKENPKGYEKSKKLDENGNPHAVLIKSNNEMKHFLETTRSVLKKLKRV